jgi:hypothetical protein
MSDDEKPSSTLPSSTNREIDADVQAQELSRIELDAPWAYRIYATVKSSLKKWLGVE